MARPTDKAFGELLPEETGDALLSDDSSLEELELPDDTETSSAKSEKSGEGSSREYSARGGKGSFDGTDPVFTGTTDLGDDLGDDLGGIGTGDDVGAGSTSSSDSLDSADGGTGSFETDYDSGYDAGYEPAYDRGYADDRGGRGGRGDHDGRDFAAKEDDFGETEHEFDALLEEGEKPAFLSDKGHKEKDEEPSFFERSSPSDFVTHADTRTTGSKEDEEIAGSDGVDIIKSKKGDDEVDGAGGDDWIRGGHGDDSLDGGAGSDTVDGEKGDDQLTYTLSENEGAKDYYDGGKGSDTLVLRMTSAEYETYKEEITNLENWIEENAK